MNQKSVGGARAGKGGTDGAPQELIPPATARNRAIVAILLPLLAALVVGVISGTLFAPAAAGDLPNAAPIFAALGIVSWFVGLRLYGLRGMALRGGRAFFAGTGFAVLVWVFALIGRALPRGLADGGLTATGERLVEIVLFVPIIAFQQGGAGRAFAYLLLFEAFAVQLWAFGVVFRALADWLGGLTAAAGSGILFGAVGYLLFRESLQPGVPALLYFLAWGLIYGIIRLRTGSILGPILVQAIQSFTTWFVFQPPAEIPPSGIAVVYIVTSILFLSIIWRLWPRRAEDYRI